MLRVTRLGLLLACLALAPAADSFADLVGPVTIGPVAEGRWRVPYITWGADVATFHANGGLETKSGSIFAEAGLDLELVAGDDFPGQVRDYLAGRSPFLRGTLRMIGMASEVLARDERTAGVCILQLSWSAGDHLVARAGLGSLADLRGKTLAIQQGGPHVGMVDDILRSAGLGWDDITVRWAKDLTASSDSPAALLRADPSIDAAAVITPDMLGLTGGLRSAGSGAEGTVKDARVLVSTAELSRSIADVYVVRRDFYQAHKEHVAAFVNGYLRGAEALIGLRKAYEGSGSQPYLDLLTLAQGIFGADVLPTLEEDAHGLVLDANLVGYPGNVVFFTERDNPTAFPAMLGRAIDLATTRGYASRRAPFTAHDLDFEALKAGLANTTVERSERFAAEAVVEEIEALTAAGGLDDRTLLSFTINFEPNQVEFPAQRYAEEYARLVELASRFGNAVIAIRGHSDPTKTLLDLVRAGLKQGILKRSGSRGDWRYSLAGKPLDLEATARLVEHIESGAFDGVPEHDPRQTMQAARNLSRARAAAVRDSVIAYAEAAGLALDPSQVQPVGVGISEPFIAKPTNMEEARANMRVEFRLLRVEAEAQSSGDFNF